MKQLQQLQLLCETQPNKTGEDPFFLLLLLLLLKSYLKSITGKYNQ